MLDYEQTKEAMWQDYHAKNYEAALATAADMLHQSHAIAAMHVAGLALARSAQVENGFNWLWASLSLSAAPLAWYINAAHAMLDAKQYQRAILVLEDGDLRHPNEVWITYLRAVAHSELMQWTPALDLLDRVIAADPTFQFAYMTKGFISHMLGRFDDALRLYDAVEGLAAPEMEDVMNNRVSVLVSCGRQREALALSLAEHRDSTRDSTLFNRSFLQLGLGQWRDGWLGYSHRELDPMTQPIARSLDEVRGKAVFLFHEQGYGDSIQFLRYAVRLRPLVKSLTIGVPPGLKRLTQQLQGCNGVSVVTAQPGEAPQVAHCEVAVPMLHCPLLFGTDLHDVPCDIPYFSVPAAVLAQHRLPPSAKPRVGLIWAGAGRTSDAKANAVDRRRSVPFATMQPLLRHADRLDFISLQLGEPVPDARLLQPLTGDWTGDFLDTGAILQQLDLLISIDSAVAHLAGALGKPVWLLSRVDGCWRWLWVDKDHPLHRRTLWYPRHRLFRQEAHDTWPEVIAEVDAALVQEFAL